ASRLPSPAGTSGVTPAPEGGTALLSGRRKKKIEGFWTARAQEEKEGRGAPPRDCSPSRSLTTLPAGRTIQAGKAAKARPPRRRDRRAPGAIRHQSEGGQPCQPKPRGT